MSRTATGAATLVGLLAISLFSGSAFASDDAHRATFQRRHAQRVHAVEEARARQEAADVAYKRMRHRGRDRGEAKAAILAEREAANEALARAERNLEQFQDQERRVGTPPGWLRNNPQLSEATPPASR